MTKEQVNSDELAARKLLLEQKIEGYRAGLSTLSGPCSQSSLQRLIDACEMELEQVRDKLDSQSKT